MALEPKFKILRQIGAGGMGVVFEALEPALDRKVAIKVLRPEAATAQATARFLREARFLARLKHPNVVIVHQAGDDGGLLWFGMDLVEGETLSQRLTRGTLSHAETVPLARDLLAALGAAHQLGIIHRDIKPSNIFLDRGGALLADFGIARSLTHDSGGSETRSRETLGTPAFMSPEQAMGQPVTPASDLYSLGLVLYLCVTGKSWPGLQPPESGDWAGVPRHLRPVLKRALELAPADRWATAADFAKALAAGFRPARLLIPLGVVALLAALWVGSRAGPDLPPIDPDGPGPRALPRSAAGLWEWSHAESLYFGGSWREAQMAYRGALERHAECLACEFRILELDRWLERRSDTARLSRLLASADRFEATWAGLVRAMGSPARDRLDRLQALVEKDYRDFTLGRYYFGEELYNRGPLFGRPRREAVAVLQEVAQQRPNFAPLWYDLTLAQIAEGDSVKADSGLTRLLAQPPTGGLAHAQRLMTALAFAFRFTDRGVQQWRQVQQDTLLLGVPEVSAGPRLMNGLGVPQGAVALGHEFEAESSPRLRRSGLIAQMLGQVALGRPVEARRTGQRLTSAFPGSSTELFVRSLSATSLLLDESVSELDLRAARADLEPMARPGNPALVRAEAAWLLSLLSLRIDPTSTSYAGAGTASGAGSGDLLVLASVLASKGRPDSALTLTESLSTDLEAWDRSEWSPVLRTVLRISRAGWQAGLGVPESARQELRWYQHFHLPDYPVDDPVPAEGDWAFGTLAAWRQARLLDHGQLDADVCDAYRLVAERWSEGEARYRIRADSAKARLAAMTCPAGHA